MRPLSLREIAEVTGGELVRDDLMADQLIGPDVVIDSRRATDGALFVAYAGEHADGHDFLTAAADNGARGFLCQRIPEGLEERVLSGCVLVEDPTQALSRLAHHVVTSAAKLSVIGITGSAGKTSTKDLLAGLLRPHGPTVAPQGSFNNEIGVPLTATQVDDDTRFLVSEMGARGIGHIAHLCEITPPQVAVVLNVGQAHLGEFGSQDQIAVAKGELVEAVDEQGWAVLNASDHRVVRMRERTRGRVALFSAIGRPLEDADLLVWATDTTADELDRHSFTLHVEQRDGQQTGAAEEPVSLPVQLQLIGRPQVANALAAVAAAVAMGLPVSALAETLDGLQAVSRWRMELHERADRVAVVNDAYNANPDSMMAACESLAAMVRRRRRADFAGAESWAVLGDMFELGEVAEAEHEAVGRAVAQLQINHLIAVGEYASAMRQAAVAAGCPDVQVAADAEQAAELVHPAPGDVVLVKASRAMGLERVADALLAADPQAPGTSVTHQTATNQTATNQTATNQTATHETEVNRPGGGDQR